jgi:hypothetical protein
LAPIGAAALFLALTVPGAARALRRRRRLGRAAAGGAAGLAAAWSEVVDSARDLHLGAPPTETPRALANRLTPAWAPGPRTALNRLVTAVELASFADGGGVLSGWDAAGWAGGDSIDVIVREMREGETRRRRAAARLFPASLLARRAARQPALGPPASAETGL